MSSTSESFQTYIQQTLSSEEKAAADAAQAAAEMHDAHLTALRKNLQTALDENDQKTAIRFAHQLLEEDGENEELEGLYEFLCTRVGVDRREPVFAFSQHPIVRTVSALCLMIPTMFLAAHFLGPGDSAGQTDVLTYLLVAVILGIPLIDCGLAAVFNRVNFYRLRE